MERRNPQSLKGGIYVGIWIRGHLAKTGGTADTLNIRPGQERFCSGFFIFKSTLTNLFVMRLENMFLREDKQMKRRMEMNTNGSKRQLSKGKAARFMAVLCAALAMAGCGGNTEEAGGETEPKTAIAENFSEADKSGTVSRIEDGEYVIGIGQFADHGSLDNCRTGFIEGLLEEGFLEGENLTIQYDNANSDGSASNLINQSYVGADVDLICAIATPMAQAAYAATRNTDIPVIYTAVTDPVAAELADAAGNPVGNITGTSDKLPVAEQLQMIRDLLPEAKTLAIMYTTSEANSASSVAEYEALAGEYGFTLNAVGISTAADIPLAADSMLENCDVVTMITDNTVVASLPVILAKANAKSIPVFGSEIEQVKIGCLAAMGLDYISLGKQTGRMAAKVLRGEAQASEMSYELIEGAAFYANTEAAEKLGITIPKDLLSGAAEVFTEITE